MITFAQLGKQGRLGNQMWQIAATVATAKRNGTTYGFPKWEYERYFNLHGCFYDSLKISSIFQEPHFHFAPPPPLTEMELVGYFQSWRYFASYEDLIKSIFEFSFSTEKNYNTASVHVRRGDYVAMGSDYHINLSYEWYQRAMSIINAPRYMIFSDDIGWCRSKFVGPRFVFAPQNNSPVEDMALMANCDHNIIANSSFSWWAAYLNKNPNKKIVAPKTWFGPKLPHDTKDLCPGDWARI